VRPAQMKIANITATSQKAKTTDHSSKCTTALLGQTVVAAQCAKKDASAIAVINESSSSATKRSKELQVDAYFLIPGQAKLVLRWSAPKKKEQKEKSFSTKL
jgi:hypothetical protein